LRRIADGNSAEQVATALNINEEAINLSLATVVTKLAANSRSQELVEAARLHLSPPVSQSPVADKPIVDYITKDEFVAFKERLRNSLVPCSPNKPTKSALIKGGDIYEQRRKGGRSG